MIVGLFAPIVKSKWKWFSKAFLYLVSVSLFLVILLYEYFTEEDISLIVRNLVGSKFCELFTLDYCYKKAGNGVFLYSSSDFLGYDQIDCDIKSSNWEANLGKLIVKSRTGQTFRGYICTNLPWGDKKKVSAGLAKRSDYLRAGVGYPDFASLLNFSLVENKSNSTILIYVSSKEIMDIRFMHLLVGLNLPNGRLLREYTVTLDYIVQTSDGISG